MPTIERYSEHVDYVDYTDDEWAEHVNELVQKSGFTPTQLCEQSKTGRFASRHAWSAWHLGLTTLPSYDPRNSELVAV